MNIRIMCLAAACAALLPAAQAADGLLAPGSADVWPQWQARISVQSATVSPLMLSQVFETANAQRMLQGGALLGDYYFARPSFGGFRASGGVLMGSLGGVPTTSSLAGPRLGLPLSNGGTLLGTAAGSDSPGAATYLGLGFTGALWRSGLAVTADVGMVAERPGAAGGVGRAIFGGDSLDGAVREMRLSPMLQLGVRYSF